MMFASCHCYKRGNKQERTVGNIHRPHSHFWLNLSQLLKEKPLFQKIITFKPTRTGEKRHQIIFFIYQSAASVTKEACACAWWRSHTAHHVREGAAKIRLLYCYWIIWWSNTCRRALKFALFQQKVIMWRSCVLSAASVSDRYRT